MMHPLFRYRTIGFSFFIEYDLCESAVGFLIQKLKINKCK